MESLHPLRNDAHDSAAIARTSNLATDWYENVDEVVTATVDAANNEASINPIFDANRRNGAVKFRASRAPKKRKIWQAVHYILHCTQP